MVNQRPTLLVVALLTTLTCAQSNYARFPGKRSEVDSPDGKYVFVNVDNQQQPHHSLFLEEKSTGRRHKISDYERSVAVVWAPNSKRFALNDYAGSDFTSTYIISVDESLPKVDIQKVIVSKFKRIARGDHDYFGVRRWLDDRRVIVNHWGHGESQPSGFCECYIYTLNGPVKQCGVQSAGNSEERCEELTP